MKDGRTHLAYKAEHAVDLESEAIMAAHVTHADRGSRQGRPFIRLSGHLSHLTAVLAENAIWPVIPLSCWLLVIRRLYDRAATPVPGA